MSDRHYIVLCGQVVGGGARPFVTEYHWDGERFTDRKKAISHGLKTRGSDDFNIGVLRDGSLISLDWMHETVESDPTEMTVIAAQIYLDEAP